MLLSLARRYFLASTSKENICPYHSSDFPINASFNSFRNLFVFFFQGRVTVELGTLKKGDILDEWYKLNAVAHKREIKGSEIGTIRLKARYTVSIAYFLFYFSDLYVL